MRHDVMEAPSTAFAGTRCVGRGSRVDVALAVKRLLERDAAAAVLVFDDATGAVVDLDLRGSTTDVVRRLGYEGAASPPRRARPEARGSRERGRPKLGVVAREVTLLPRHWEWLATQPGGASAALRRLVDQARRQDGGRSEARAAREAAYRFMSAMAGDLPQFEDASRALFAGDRQAFGERTAAWPPDVRDHAERLAWPSEEARETT